MIDGETKDGAQPAATDRGVSEGIGDAADRLRPGCGARPATRRRPARRTRAGAPDHLACGTFHEQMACRAKLAERRRAHPHDAGAPWGRTAMIGWSRSEEHTSELQSLMRIP